MYMKAFLTQERKTMMQVGVHEIRGNLADVINRVAYGGERIILERRSKPVLALVSMEDLELLEEMENRSDIRGAEGA